MAAFDQASRRQVYTLSFELYGGMVVLARKPSFRGLELLAHATSVLGERLDSMTRPIGDRIDAWGSLFRAFAEALVWWDLRDNGISVPATLDGVLSQDHEFLLEISRMWYRRVALHIALPAESTREDDQPDTDEEEDDVLASLPTITLPDPELPADALVS